ncbi:hypothetical protein [Aliagarivorans taiwanensis]|uniref:hypothetical protein n=1 Tax=Aliagarivorans taiwanensis TaxID=561966 RepID=UPI000421F3EC|nr:hypothetical protein [Aliagarivorans taiwanensis]
MAYVDLNPIRAATAVTPEESDHTSVRRRIEQAKQGKQPVELMPFVGNPRKDMPEGLPFSLTDYLELVELTGRVVREDKRGFIDSQHNPILQRLGIDEQSWLAISTGIEQHFGGVVGAHKRMQRYKADHHQQRLQGMGSAKRWLNSA